MTDTRLQTPFGPRRRAAAAMFAAAALTAPCHRHHPAQPSPATERTRTCTAGSPFSPPLWYTRGGRIEGSVRDSAGAVVASGRVLLTPLNDEGRFVGADLTPNGTFAIDSVPAARYAAHIVGPATFAPLDATVRVAPGDDSVRVVLGRSAPCK